MPNKINVKKSSKFYYILATLLIVMDIGLNYQTSTLFWKYAKICKIEFLV